MGPSLRQEVLAMNSSTENIVFNYLPVKWITETPQEQEFCVNPLVPIGAVTLINAHGGTGKSLFALKMAAHIALGLPIVGAETNAGKVAYISLEDSENSVRNRIFKTFNSLPEEAQQRIEELTTKIMIIDRYGIQTHMAIHEDGNIVTSPIARDLSKLLKENEITCVFVDTLIRTNGLNENDNTQMGALLVAFEGIAKEAKCAVVLIHHTAKSSSDKNNGSKYAARGASAITDNARSALLLEKKDELIKIIHVKHNYSAQHPAQYLEMTEDGVLIEASPCFGINFTVSKRYKELYEWWENAWGRKELTQTNIDQNTEKIRPPGSKYGKNVYKDALSWAVDKGYVKKVPAPEDRSKNPKAMYYILSPITEQEPADPPIPSNNPPE